MTHISTHTGKYVERIIEHWTGSFSFTAQCFSIFLWVLFACHIITYHEVARGFRHLCRHLLSCVGGDAENEAHVVVVQHTGDCLAIHTALQSWRGECVTQIAGVNMFQFSVFKDFLMDFYHRVGVGHFVSGG